MLLTGDSTPERIRRIGEKRLISWQTVVLPGQDIAVGIISHGHRHLADLHHSRDATL